MLIFGFTDENFSTIGDSITTLFMMLLGNYYTVQIQTTSTTIMHLFGISYTIIMIVIMNIVVAIIGTHYYEFYVEQGANPNNMLKVILRYIIDKRKERGITHNRTYFQKISNLIFRWLDRWISVVVEEEMIDNRKTKLYYLKQAEHDIHIPTGFLDIVDKMNGDKEEGLYKNSNMKKMHFWVTLIDHAISRKIRQGYFENLYNDNSLFENPIDRFHQKYDMDPNFDYKYLYFIMSKHEARIQIWKDADIDMKLIFWN